MLERYQHVDQLRKPVLTKAAALAKETGCNPKLLALVGFAVHAVPDETDVKEDLLTQLAQDLKDPEQALLIFLRVVPVFRAEADVLVKALIEDWNKWAKVSVA